MSDAISRIQGFLDTGSYRVLAVREVKPNPEVYGAPAWVAVVERVDGDPDDTIECVFVELETNEEVEWARGMVG